MLTDSADRIVAVLVGRPADVAGRPTWDETTTEVLRQMESLEEELNWNGDETLPRPPSSDGKNRRGNYRTCSLGPSYGGGQKIRSTPTKALQRIDMLGLVVPAELFSHRGEYRSVGSLSTEPSRSESGTCGK